MAELDSARGRPGHLHQGNKNRSFHNRVNCRDKTELAGHRERGVLRDNHQRPGGGHHQYRGRSPEPRGHRLDQLHRHVAGHPAETDGALQVIDFGPIVQDLRFPQHHRQPCISVQKC